MVARSACDCASAGTAKKGRITTSFFIYTPRYLIVRSCTGRHSTMPFAQQLGRYQLLDRIAFGGMAEIFRAKTFDHEGRAHLVAVKRVLNHLTHDDDFLRMLVDEAKLTALLQHDNIARVYEFA